MPLLKYFAIVGSILLVLLFVADAMLTSPKHPVYASKFDLRPPDWLTNTSGHLVTTDLAPAAPHIAKIPRETGAAIGVAPPAAAQTKTPAADMQKAEIKKRKPRAAHRRTKPQPSADPWADPDPWDAFAYAPQARKTGRKFERRTDPTPLWFR